MLMCILEASPGIPGACQNAESQAPPCPAGSEPAFNKTGCFSTLRFERPCFGQHAEVIKNLDSGTRPSGLDPGSATDCVTLGKLLDLFEL